jgi:hypothetical protein
LHRTGREGIEASFTVPFVAVVTVHGIQSADRRFLNERPFANEPPVLKRLRRGAGVLGLMVSLALILWVPVGLVPGVPGPIDVFGIDGLREPASFAVGGLVLAAIGFFEP